MTTIIDNQVGSKFGAAVAAIDITGDDYDEIFVGAPLYSDEQTEEGRVFVYTTTDYVRKWHFFIMKIKLRSFKSCKHINEKGDGPFCGFSAT